MDATAWVELVIIIVALVVAALAASAETSLTSISRVRLRRLVQEKVPAAILIERLHRDPNSYLSTVLIANTVAIIVASSAATLLSLHLYQAHVAQWLVSLILSLIVLTFCEIAPKTLALQRAERVALNMARIVAGATWLMRPIVMVLTAITKVLVQRLRWEGAGEGPVRDRRRAEDAGLGRRGGGGPRGRGARDDPRDLSRWATCGCAS